MGVYSANASDKSQNIEYLSDIFPYRIPFVQQGWGKLGIDTATYAPDKTPMSLRINDKEYSKGLGTHAPGEIIVELNGEYETFESEIGVQRQLGDNVGSVVFQVFVDDEKRFDSGIVRELDPARLINISVSDAQELRLIVTDAGDGITCDCANWANARLIRSKVVTSKSVIEPVDIAQFARVVNSDPNRNDGCRCSRVEEFPADDIFLENNILSDSNGAYTVPVNSDGIGCIGLKWYESRLLRELALQFTGDSYIPSLDNTQIQGWFGESAWQGSWKPIKCAVKQEDNKAIFQLNLQENPDLRGVGTEKVRWIFPKSEKPIKINCLSAFTHSQWKVAELQIELEKPMINQFGEIRIYNGVIISSENSKTKQTWNLAKPTDIKIRYNRSRFSKSDRTVITFGIPDKSFGVAVDDVVTNGCVYVRSLGVFISSKPAKYTLAEYKRIISEHETILQKVRKMPDQIFQQALEKVHRPVQDNGPTMLSLACDNSKFVVQRDGSVRFNKFELIPEIGSGRKDQLNRCLYDNSWLPIPVTTIQENGITYTQRTFVVPYDKTDTRTWLNRQPLCVAEFIIENIASSANDVSLKLKFFADAEKQELPEIRQDGNGIIIQWQSKILAFVDIEKNDSLKIDIKDGVIILNGALSPQKRQRCYVYIPAWDAKPEDSRINGGDKLISDVEDYWKRVLGTATQIEIPDQYLLNVIKASQVHCFMAARNDFDGKLIQPWIASMSYGPLESEAHSIVRGMGLLGHREFAQKGLDFFIYRYNAAGFLTTGYTLMGTGWHLWTLGEYYQLSHDSEWLKQNAQALTKICSWIVKQIEKTKRLDAKGEKMVEYGLMPPGVVADWNRFAYRTYMEGNYFAGLYGTAKALSDIGYPDADLLLTKALEFKNDITRAYKWTQERSPVLPISDGSWVLPYPGMIFCFGLVGEMYQGEDWNRTWAGDVEIGSHHLVPLGIIDPKSSETEHIADHMEDYWFLKSGMGEYTEEENKKDWFNLGGFAKVQPYYGRTAEIYAMRDDVKPFIRSYFNAIPSLLNTENLSFWEHFHNIGAWNKTHETGSFLQQTRFMFVFEHGDELWLAPFITNNWMKDGMVVAVQNAPTRFGAMSYRITSSVDKGFIDAVIDPPKYLQPKEIVIRLRHPDGKHIKKVTVNGADHKEFDNAKECIRIKPISDKITIHAEY